MSDILSEEGLVEALGRMRTSHPEENPWQQRIYLSHEALRDRVRVLTEALAALEADYGQMQESSAFRKTSSGVSPDVVGWTTRVVVEGVDASGFSWTQDTSPLYHRGTPTSPAPVTDSPTPSVPNDSPEVRGNG
jgi:hypothetical protein